MVSPLKGLTRAQIVAQAAARRARLAAAKAAKGAGKGKKGASKTTRTRVSQTTVNNVLHMGRTAAQAAAARAGASAEFKMAVSRVYPAHGHKTVKATKKSPVKKKTGTKLTLRQRKGEKLQ